MKSEEMLKKIDLSILKLLKNICIYANRENSLGVNAIEPEKINILSDSVLKLTEARKNILG